MKYLLPAMLIGASTACAGVESTFTVTPPHYLLLHPKATLETDAGGGCQARRVPLPILATTKAMTMAYNYLDRPA